MLFGNLTRVLRHRTDAARDEDDRGVAMAAVIGLMAVGMVLTSVIATSVVSGLAQTSSTRADVQSQASAEAGVAAAREAIANGVCLGTLTHVFTSSSPQYTATVYRPRVAGSSPSTASDWVAGCPLVVNSADKLRIVSIGAAAAKGVTGVSAGDVSTIEVVMSGIVTTVTPGTPAIPGTSPTPATVPLTPSGPAVYAYSSAGFGGSGTLASVAGSDPDVMIKTGNVSCSGASYGVDDFIVGGGDLTLDGSCNASGDVFATGRATLNGATALGGSVIAKGVSFSGSASVAGSVWSTSDVSMPGTASVGGNVTASSLSMNGSAQIKKSAWVYGDTSLDWSTRVGSTLTTKTIAAANSGSYGKLTLVPSGPGVSPWATPTAPTIPNWVDFSSTATWPGFTTQTISGACSYTTLVATVALFLGNPGVIDARGCTNGFVIGGADALTLPGDIAIIAKKFDLGGSGSFRGSKKLWLVIPDDTADGKPTCPSGGSFTLDGAFVAQPTTMIYSPCKVNLGSATNLKGQIYAGTATIDGASRLAYVQVGIPGYDLNTGSSNTTTPTAGTPGTPGTPDVVTYTPRSIETYRTLQNGTGG